MPNTLEYFKEITKYPRPSKKEEKIRDFLVDFFSKKDYKYEIDKIGNLIVYVPNKNSLSKETVILQAHMDMVCVKIDDSNHNFLNDPIPFYEKDGFLYAKNTTLGADNGIGIALIMSVIENAKKYSNLELVFTVDEEAGMSGVFELDYSLLSGTKIINLDNESEDIICISSAGGIGIFGEKKLELTNSEFDNYELEIFGMKGGHSGVEIDKNRGNAITIFIDFLLKNKNNIEIININSGTFLNVIPSKVEATIGIKDINIFKENLKNYIKEIKNTYDCPLLDFKINLTNESEQKVKNGVEIIEILSKIKNGIYSMSEKIDGLVQTSMNFGILNINKNLLKYDFLARSSDNEELKNLKNDMRNYLEKNNFEVNFDRGYSGWQDDPNSELLKVAKTEFKKVLGKDPEIIAIHAGLECGTLVSSINKKTNAISIGPNMEFVHSVDEKAEISSIEKMEKILFGILGEL